MEEEAPPVPPAPPIVAMLPSPGMGHLIPMIEFTKRVVCYHNLAVSFMIPSDDPPSKAQEAVLKALPDSISHTFPKHESASPKGGRDVGEQ